MTEDLQILDIGDEVNVKKRRTKRKSREEQEAEDLRVLLTTYQGRSFVWRILSECNIYGVGLMHTPEATAHRLGKRDLGIWILQEMNKADNTAYIRMQNEAIDRDKEDRNG